MRSRMSRNCRLRTHSGTYDNGMALRIQRPQTSSSAVQLSIRLRRIPPAFLPEKWNLCEATLTDSQRTSKCKSWNNGLSVIQAMQMDAAMVATALMQHGRGQLPAKNWVAFCPVWGHSVRGTLCWWGIISFSRLGIQSFVQHDIDYHASFPREADKFELDCFSSVSFILLQTEQHSSTSSSFMVQTVKGEEEWRMADGLTQLISSTAVRRLIVRNYTAACVFMRQFVSSTVVTLYQ